MLKRDCYFSPAPSAAWRKEVRGYKERTWHLDKASLTAALKQAMNFPIPGIRGGADVCKPHWEGVLFPLSGVMLKAWAAETHRPAFLL